MNFLLTEDQQAFRTSVLRLSDKHLKAGARGRAHALDYPWDVARLFAANGLLGITISEKDGGQGGSLMDAVMALSDEILVLNFGAVLAKGKPSVIQRDPRVIEAYLGVVTDA